MGHARLDEERRALAAAPPAPESARSRGMAGGLLALQRPAGNQALARLLARRRAGVLARQPDEDDGLSRLDLGPGDADVSSCLDLGAAPGGPALATLPSPAPGGEDLSRFDLALAQADGPAAAAPAPDDPGASSASTSGRGTPRRRRCRPCRRSPPGRR